MRTKPRAPRRADHAETGTAATDQRFRLLFEHNLAGVYRTTLGGEFLDCNESLAAMLGYRSRRDLLRHPSQVLYFKPADRANFLTRLRKTGRLTNSELRLRRKDGSPIHILENVSLAPDERGRLRIIQGTMVDITERKRAEEALRESERRYQALAQDLRRLTHHLQTVREEERARIARELHDELGQTLTVLNMDLHWLGGQLASGTEAARTRIRAMCNVLDTTLQTVRRICADLRPTILDDFGLAAAIEWQAREFETRTGIRCRVSLPNRPATLIADQAVAVFRILQESLTNVARHARAAQVRVTLQMGRTRLVLKVVDDGVGMVARRATDARKFGLTGMRERALRWGGELAIAGNPGHGTTVKLQMPLHRADGARVP